MDFYHRVKQFAKIKNWDDKKKAEMLKDPNAFAREEKRHSNYLNRKKKIDDPLMDRIYKEGMDRKVRLEQVKLQNENNKIEESRINANKAFLDRP